MTGTGETTGSGDGVVRLLVDTTVHSREAVFAAAYVFIDRCYVWLDKTSDGRLVIELRPRGGSDLSAAVLEGEFQNELLSQSCREQVLAQNAALVQAIVARGLAGAGATGAPGTSLDLAELEALELEDEPFDDPLGIALSWEEKYAKRSPDDPSTDDSSTEGPKK